MAERIMASFTRSMLRGERESDGIGAVAGHIAKDDELSLSTSTRPSPPPPSSHEMTSMMAPNGLVRQPVDLVQLFAMHDGLTPDLSTTHQGLLLGSC